MELEFCFEFRNDSCIKRDYSMPILVTLYIIFGVKAILTVCGNLLVILSISYFKQLHSPTNYLILSLAMSDVLVRIIVMVPFALQVVESCWYFGDFLCNLNTSCTVSLVTASIINLSLISIDRYYAVCQPLLYRARISTNVVLIMISVCWTVSLIVGLGLVFMTLSFVGKEDLYRSRVSCKGECTPIPDKLSGTLGPILSFYMPEFILFGVYLKMLFVAKRQFSTIQNNSGVTSNNRSQAKATKTLAIIMGVFYFSWAPFFLLNLIIPFSRNLIPHIFNEAFAWVGLLNSATLSSGLHMCSKAGQETPQIDFNVGG